MSIRIGSSCALSVPMVKGYVAETRILTDNSAKWQEVAQHCIKNNIYLIVSPCVSNGYNQADVPTNYQWQTLLHESCRYLKFIGANKYNARLSLINEPMKFITKEKYKELIDLAVPIIHSYGFYVGCGNEEFVMSAAHGNMYQYILSNCNFDVLDLHLQGSCDSWPHIEKYLNEVKSWVMFWPKPVDCTEAFYGNVTKPEGYWLLQAQLQMAKELKCENFCNVFNNLDTSVFPILSDPEVKKKWYELCFNINGAQHSQYWQAWQNQMEINKPVPNISIPKGKDGMILPSVKLGTKGYLTELVEELLQYLGYEIDSIDGNFTTDDVNELKRFQEDIQNKYPNIDVDGICGRKCYFYLINEILDSSGKRDFQFKLEVYGSPAS